MPATLAEKLRGANALLMSELKHLEELTGSMRAVSASEINRRLRSLHSVLVAHFQLEEQTEYLSPVVACGGEMNVKRRVLLDEHRHLLESLETLIAFAEHGEGLTARLRDKLTHWIQESRQHEKRETEFFDEAEDEKPC